MGLIRFSVKQATVIAGLVCGALLPCGIQRAAKAQSSYTTNLQVLNVTVGFDKTRIKVGEPVTMSIQMEAGGGRSLVEVSASLQFPEGNGIELNVQPPGELDYQYSGALEEGAYPARPMRVVQGLPQRLGMLLLYDRTQPNGYLFSKPGNYRLSGEVRLHINNNPTPDVALIPVTEIEVLPRDGADSDVFQLLDEPNLAQALHLGVTPTTAILETLKPVGEKYAHTQLGALALRSVGQQLALQDGGTRREEGAAMLQNYLASGLVPVDGDYTAWAVAVAYHFSGNYDLAREWIYYSMRKYPTSVRIRQEDPLYKYYFFDPASFASQVPWYLLKEPWKIPGAKPPEELKAIQPE